MDLEEAKLKFVHLLSDINSTHVFDFFQWIKSADQFNFKESADAILENIAEDIRSKVPFEATLPSERISIPIVGKNADCANETTVHVDNFLYDDEYLDDLVDQGTFSRNYCKACGSRDTVPLTFISHSSSPSVLKFLFKKALPDLKNKVLVDVGSRLGPVLYAAHLYTSCLRIIGVENNKDLCNIQQETIKKYGMDDRITIINADVQECNDLLISADIIVMNNVFEFFTEPSLTLKLWKFIVNTLKGPDKVLVTIPSLEESFQPLGIAYMIDDWVEEVPIAKLEDDLEDIHLYKLR